MKRLTKIRRGTWTHVNKHSTCWYQDEQENIYILSRTDDGCPPFFDAYGPFKDGYKGIPPRLRVHGKEYWGYGWSWNRAIRAFCKEIGAEIRRHKPRISHGSCKKPLCAECRKPIAGKSVLGEYGLEYHPGCWKKSDIYKELYGP